MDFTGSKQPKSILVLNPQSRDIPSLTRDSGSTRQIAGQNIRFIHSYTLGTPPDVQGTLLKLIECTGLSSNRGLPMRLTGILFIHYERYSYHEPSLRKSLQVLRALIGERYLNRVTIILKAEREQWRERAEDTLRSIMRPGTALYSFCRGVTKPRVFLSDITERSINYILSPYSSFGPQRFYAQDKLLAGDWQIEDVTSYLQQLPEGLAENQPKIERQIAIRVLPCGSRAIDYEVPTDPVDVKTGDNNRATKEQPGSKREARRSWDPPELEKNREEVAQSNQSGAGSGSSGSAYKDQSPNIILEQAQADLVASQGQLQVHNTNNTELAQILQTFDEINRLIEKLGQSFSEPYSRSTTRDLEFSRLDKLAEMFGHSAGKPSLVRSLSGEYPNLEDFFFSAIRAILCTQLDRGIFKPFHPSLAEKDHERENIFMLDLYKQMTCQEPQPVAGRWRTESFNLISRRSFTSNQTYISATRRMIITAISELTETVFDRKTIGLSKDQEPLLTKLITMAESWNRLVKGSVIAYGDIQPIVFPYGCDFQQRYMHEYAAKPDHTDYPGVSLATVELGLINNYAVGGNRVQEVTVLRKAKIVSERLLYW